jgi:undecaprenyl phosphate-alpha-L-ara4N flippase subunit ArnF
VRIKKGYGFAIASLCLSSAAQLFMKWGVMQLPELDLDTILLQRDLLSQSFFGLGLGVIMYIGSILLWVSTLIHLPLSIAYPLVSLSYVLVYFLAVELPWFHETWHRQGLIGVGLILLGICITFYSPKRKPGPSNPSHS